MADTTSEYGCDKNTYFGYSYLWNCKLRETGSHLPNLATPY